MAGAAPISKKGPETNANTARKNFISSCNPVVYQLTDAASNAIVAWQEAIFSRRTAPAVALGTCPAHRSLPFAKQAFPETGGHLRLKSSLRAPEAFHLFQALPEASRQAGQVGGAQRRGFDVHRTNDRLAEDVRLELHQKAVHRRAAIHAQFAQQVAGVGLHGFHQFPSLVGDAL